MASTRKTGDPAKPRHPPGTTIESRENQMIALAVDVAEKQLRNNTASAQVISHYLKLGTVREQLEQDKLRQENGLLQAKIEAMASQTRIEEMYKDALNAMSRYQGQGITNSYDD